MGGGECSCYFFYEGKRGVECGGEGAEPPASINPFSTYDPFTNESHTITNSFCLGGRDLQLGYGQKWRWLGRVPSGARMNVSRSWKGS